MLEFHDKNVTSFMMMAFIYIYISVCCKYNGQSECVQTIYTYTNMYKYIYRLHVQEHIYIYRLHVQVQVHLHTIPPHPHYTFIYKHVHVFTDYQTCTSVPAHIQTWSYMYRLHVHT